MPKSLSQLPVTEECYLQGIKDGHFEFGGVYVRECVHRVRNWKSTSTWLERSPEIHHISTQNFGVVSIQEYYNLTKDSYNRYLTWK